MHARRAEIARVKHQMVLVAEVGRTLAATVVFVCKYWSHRAIIYDVVVVAMKTTL